jgi:hypothetical protein
MEIIISSIVGAISAVLVALIHNLSNQKKREKAVKDLVSELNINNGNIFIIDSNLPKEKKPTMQSHASQEKIVFIIK